MSKCYYVVTTVEYEVIVRADNPEEAELLAADIDLEDMAQSVVNVYATEVE